MTSENNQGALANRGWMMVGEAPWGGVEGRVVALLDRKKPDDVPIISNAPWRAGCEAQIDAFMQATRDRAAEKITEHRLDEVTAALDGALKALDVGYYARIKIRDQLTKKAITSKPKPVAQPVVVHAPPLVRDTPVGVPKAPEVRTVVSPGQAYYSFDRMQSIKLPPHNHLGVLMLKLTNQWSLYASELSQFNRFFESKYRKANEVQREEMLTEFRALIGKTGLSDEVSEAVINYRVAAALGGKYKGSKPKNVTLAEGAVTEPVAVPTPETPPVVAAPNADAPPQVVDGSPSTSTQTDPAPQGNPDGFRQYMRKRYAHAGENERGILSTALRAVMDEEGVPPKIREAALRDTLGLRKKSGTQNDWQERTAGDASSKKVR